MGGQSVYNNIASRGGADIHPGDGLYLLLRRLMGDDAPSKSEVRTASDGYPASALERFCAQVEQEYERKKGTSAGARITPWSHAKSILTNQQHLKR
jgi:hypothetical protein